MNISFCKADYKDLKKLLSLCREAVNAPYSTWNEDYPNEEILKQDIAAGTLYIIQIDYRDAGLIAAGENGELNCLPWDGAACRPCEIARFGLVSQMRGKGLSRLVLKEAIELCKQQGFDTIRLIASCGQPVVKRLYEGEGFQSFGTARLFEHDFVCYQKRIV